MRCKSKENLSKIFSFAFLFVLVTLVSAQKPHVTCHAKHKKIGCFNKASSLTLLFSDRALNGAMNKGHLIDWYNWEQYMHSLACRCNEEADKLGLNYFQLRWYGLCYGSKNMPEAAAANSGGCIGQGYQPCVDSAITDCVGTTVSDYVYQVGRDGGFSDWGNFSACSESCGDGSMLRIRNCSNPFPSGYGKECSHLGSYQDVQACNKRPCAVNGGFSKWSAFGNCSKTCGGGNMTRHRTCNNPAPADGGADCVGPRQETKLCNKHSCPVNGGFSKWFAFGNCSKTCGGGNMTRHRTCNNPAPAHGGADCVGPRKETKPCNKNSCPVNGGLSKWSAFGNCSKTCEGGHMTRHRTCNNPAPAHGGADCVGPRKETRSCNTQTCPVDGGLSSWSVFGKCSRTCGEGVTTRQRFCNNPKPAHGGKNCSEHLIDRKSCMHGLCAGPDGASEAREIISNFLLTFHKETYPMKGPSGKFHKAIDAITKATADEFTALNPGVSLEKRLNDLRRFLKVATEGGSINFARTALGKSLFVLMKKQIEEGLTFEEIEKGTKGYLESIKKDIGSQKFGEIMLENGDATLMFAIDTSASMADEIEAAKAIATSIIDRKRDFPVDYILSPFNDPGYGPVTYKNATYRKGFVNAIQSLTVTGGTDCPELVFTGMIEAFKAGPQLGSSLFVFTDASAKDDSFEKIEELKAAAHKYASTINFFTDIYGCGDAKGISSFRDIASYTSGQVFPMRTHAELKQFKDYVANSLTGGTVIAQHSFTFFGSRFLTIKTFKIDVDSEITSLMISLDVKLKNSTKLVQLTDPSGKVHNEQSITTYTKVYNIKNPSPGAWYLSFPIKTLMGSFTAKAVQSNYVEVSHHFLHQETASKDSPVLRVANPLKGKLSTMVIQISNTELLKKESLKADLINEKGERVLSNLVLNSVNGAAGSFKTTINSPSGKLKVAVRGVTKKGYAFQRISYTTSEVQNAIMAAINGGADFTIPISQGSASIKVYVYNQGEAARFNFQSEASYGVVDADVPSVMIPKASNTTVSFTYYYMVSFAPRVGKTDVIKVVAVDQGSRKTQISVDVLLLE